ncbi:unnamed protein product [Dibothriocephalus latus]|uniref:Uncharacterized protein n=1 Tax=Dibothriocephalus latus TaxID=60516 RepID=A0A3P7Q2N8_DIBLA|nr:unnamed protein product [Dibothriocephalus latus]
MIKISIQFKSIDFAPGTFVAVDIHQHDREHETEEGRCEGTALLYSIGHGEGFGNRPAFRDMRHHPVVELTYHVNEVLRTAEFLNDFPQSDAIHCRYGYESSVEVSAYFLALISRLLCDEDHVDGAVRTTKAALAFRQEPSFQVIVEIVRRIRAKIFPAILSSELLR